jgi:hypothetical protein
MKNRRHFKEIKVCAGPGCKAWASDKIASELEGLELEGYRVCRVSCMKKCGGGTTVQTDFSGEPVKMHNPEEVLQVLLAENSSLALTVS